VETELAAVVGTLGETAEDHERKRVAQLAAHGPQPAVPTKELAATPDVRKALQILVRQEFSGVREDLEAIRHSIASNTEALRLADIPMEQVADSHERATHSFETLRADLVRLEERLAAVESSNAQILQELRR
jgi:hypothetical protein